MQIAAVFIDTSALLAISFKRDGLHERAMEVHRRLTAERTPIVTTDWVLSEFLSCASTPERRGAAIAAVDRVRGSARARVLEASRDSWARAFDYYKSRADKGWSHIDCTSMLACRELGIDRVFTADHHFVQAGFDVLLS